MLRDFIELHRDEILDRARLRVAARRTPAPTPVELTLGLPIFVDQLREALRKTYVHEVLDHDDLKKSAHKHGDDLFARGLSVAQVVHDYGDLCQVITGLAFEAKAAIGDDEFQTLNLCLDDAIADAVTAHASRRESAIADAGTERLGILAHEMRNELQAAIVAFASIKKGHVPASGSTGEILERCLLRLNTLIDRSLADVRLDAGLHQLQRVAVRDVIDEVELSASVQAGLRGLTLTVTTVDATVIVEADRQILAAAVANLMQNALKFTRPGTTVLLRASTTTSRVLIEVEDECGGLPDDMVPESLFQPFVQRGTDRTGVGLGLNIVQKAVKAMAGELRVRDLPGKGCVFTIDLPKQPPPPTAIHARDRKHGDAPDTAGGSAARAV
jgi:signal transduction histidine kinase